MRRPLPAPDRTFMRRALVLARRGWGQTAPNPMVGAVVVSRGKVVGEGYHARYGGDHAEVVALTAAASDARGATVYVTLEPCAHQGKTPPCVEALIAAGVARVVIATLDPNPEAGGGAALLEAAGISVETGAMEAEALELNAPFFHQFGSDRPWITLKLALSLDGAIADARRGGGWLTGKASRKEVHRLRAGHDAVAVALGTARADNPLLTVREVRSPRVPPLRVVFDDNALLPLDSALVSTARETPLALVASSASPDRISALEERGVNVIVAPSLPEALRELKSRGVNSMLVEGGAKLAGAFMDRALVDRLVIFRAPIVLGRDALNGFAFAPSSEVARAQRLRVIATRSLGDDTMTVYGFGDR